MRCAANDQSAHAVADQGYLLDGHGPLGHHPIEQAGEPTAVFRDVQAGVVADVQRSVAEIALETRAVGGVSVPVVPLCVQAP
jgi:hypothetical protein